MGAMRKQEPTVLARMRSHFGQGYGLLVWNLFNGCDSFSTDAIPFQRMRFPFQRMRDSFSTDAIPFEGSVEGNHVMKRTFVDTRTQTGHRTAKHPLCYGTLKDVTY